MIDYTKYLKPIGVSGFVCVDCGKSLSTCDRYCECPDCGAIFCEDCVINYVLNNHICEYDNMEPYLDDKDFIQNESDFCNITNEHDTNMDIDIDDIPML